MKRLVIIFLVISTIDAYSQNDYKTLSNQWVVYRDTNSGLPYNQVNKIKVDKFDNKWLLDGIGNLVKFDGTTWTVYPNKGGSAIAIDKNDNKWIAKGTGLEKFDNTSFTIYNSSNSCISAGTIYDCHVDSSNNVWLATDLGSVEFKTNDSCNLYSSPFGSVQEIKVDSRNWIWCVYTGMTGWAFTFFDGVSWQDYPFGRYISSWNANARPTHLFCDSIGNVWGNAWNDASGTPVGIFKYDGVNFSVPYDTSTSFNLWEDGSVYAKNNIVAAQAIRAII